MQRWIVKIAIAALVVVTIASAGAPRALATVTGGGMCWVPDWEFPVPCADIDED